LEQFGPDRIRDTPLSESAFVGAGIGAALAGMRPIVEVMTVNFSLLALDQIMNNAATLLHVSGGQLNVPLVIRMTGAGRQLAAQHSHSLEGWYAHIPGLRVLAPATLADARGMLWPRCRIRTRCSSSSTARCTTPPANCLTMTARWTSQRGDPASGQRHLAGHLWRNPQHHPGGCRRTGRAGHRRRGDRPASAPAAR